MRRASLFCCVAVASACAVGFGLTLAQARPPGTGATRAPGSPLVGRVRTHDAILDLTVDSVGQGGPAHEVGRGVAGALADIERARGAAPGMPDAPRPIDSRGAGLGE